MKRVKNIFLKEALLIILLLIIDKSFIIAFISIAIHEASHIILASIEGSKFANLQFHVYGAKVQLMEIDELKNKQKILIYVVGPLSNVIIAIIGLIIYIHYKSNFLHSIITLNLGLAIFNLLPAYPLDGARILEIFLSKKMSYRTAQGIISIISYAIAAFFILASILFCIYEGVFNITMLIGGLIIISITRSEKKSTMYILMGSIFRKRTSLIKNKYIENKTISVYYRQGLVNLMTMVDKNRFNSFFVLDDDIKILFILHEDELIEALKEHGNITLEEYQYLRKSN